MLPSPLASLSCFHYFADKQSKNARSTTEKPVRHGRTAGVCLTKRERPESRNAGPRESSLKTLHDENGQGMRQPVRSSGRQAKTRKRTDTSFRPERELQRLRAVRRGYSSLAVQVVVADDDYERARDLLAEETASERPIVCPECGSQDVRSEVGETRLKRFGAYLLAGLGALGNGSAGNIRRYFRCNRCGTPFH